MLIKDTIKRDLSSKIPEVIQVDQMDEQQVHDEISDYVVTDRIKKHYHDLLKAIVDGQTQPDENVGVWISGFFGSGKSSFAKNLGYVLANRTVLGQSASALFSQQVDDNAVSNLVALANKNIPTEVVMFDISKEKTPTNTVTQVMYRALLRALGYAEDFDIAELEISLEREGKLAEFESRFDSEYANGSPKTAWRGQGRSGVQVWNRAGVVLNQMDPRTYPTPESFARALVNNRVVINPQVLVQRAFDLMTLRRPKTALLFVMDEVGAFVAYSEDRLEDLRAVIEEFGKQSQNRVRAKRAIAPTWVVVTSQERLDEVLSALGADKRVLLAKVQDRFHYKVDMSPADIREVTTRRVLSKHDAGLHALETLYRNHEGALTNAVRLERSQRNQTFSAAEFAQFYPYLPHYIELSIDIVAGIRLQAAGAVRHISGSNRTIISQVHQMLVSPRTNYANKALGALVSLDCVYDLIEGHVGTARQRDIGDIDARSKSHEVTAVRNYAGRVARVISLLEFVRDLPRTPRNIAALLVNEVGQAAPEPEVQEALNWLVTAEFARETELGYKLQTAQEKTWSTERKGFEPRARDRAEIERELIKRVFEGTSALRSFSYRQMKNLRLTVSVNDSGFTDSGQLPLAIIAADNASELNRKIPDTRTESRTRKDVIYWVFALTPEIDALVTNLFASRQMVAKYDALQGQNKINQDEQASLVAEREESERLKGRLHQKLLAEMAKGTGLFDGESADSATLGEQFPDALRGLFEKFVPKLYSKLEMGARALKGGEPVEILTAANLNALSQVFYGGPNGLGLVSKQGDRTAPDMNAPIAKEVLDYIRHEHGYGNRVTGKTLSEKFLGVPYGWDTDVLRLVTATMLRAGAIEVAHQGRRYRNHQDPQCRAAFEKIPQFNSAVFTPREGIDLKALISAVKNYETLTGEDVDVEEGAIATALKKLAAGELAEVIPVLADARANRLPIEPALREYRAILEEIVAAASDDCVRLLIGQGATIKASRETFRKMREAVSDTGLDQMRTARGAIEAIWPLLRGRSADQTLAGKAEALSTIVASDTYFSRLGEMQSHTQALREAYRVIYVETRQRRRDAFTRAIEQVKDQPEWVMAFPPKSAEADRDRADRLLLPLQSRVGDGDLVPLLDKGADGATLPQMESDLAAVESIKSDVIRQLQALAAPEQSIYRVRVADFVRAQLIRPTESGGAEAQKGLDQQVEELLQALRIEIYKRLAEADVVILE